MDEANNSNKMSDEERSQLAAKLDKELEKYIDSLPKTKYEDGWNEDNWEEEMESHPFFMTKTPEASAELNPLYEGLQQLKYDPDVNSPQELATSYKEDGIFNFKHKNYRLAIIAFTEGLKAKCDDTELNASLYNNRSAAHYFLKNYRSSLRDSESALKLKPNYPKTLYRAAQCCYETNKLELCISYCDKILGVESKNERFSLLKEKVEKILQKQRMNQKLDERNERKKEKMVEKLYKAIVERGIKIENDKNGLLELFHNCYEEFVKIRLEKDGSLVWPVKLLYPENYYEAPDYIQSFPEGCRFVDIFQDVFSSPAEWDPQHMYKLDTINVYYKSTMLKLTAIRLSDTLGEVLARKDFIVENGTPVFLVFRRGSEMEQRFINSM